LGRDEEGDDTPNPLQVINSYSHYRESENVKPIFLKDEDVFGSRKPERSLWLTNVEIYKAIGDKVQAHNAIIHQLLTSQSLNDLVNLIFTQLIIQ
jgi:hypothetical protein